MYNISIIGTYTDRYYVNIVLLSVVGTFGQGKEICIQTVQCLIPK